ncbi:MAG: ATP-grasp domain-containing protein [Planctomycetes bacterium]|nr:ATP-grasp domain-containing protein [Planctomycetota bacterium]
MKTTRLMTTSGGGPGVWGLLYALRRLPGRQTTLIVSDPEAVSTLGTAFGDVRVQLCRASSPAYVDELLACCQREAVDVLLPVYDGELLAVARRSREFEQAGTRVLLPPADVVALCVDKRQTYTRLAGTGFLPAYSLASTIDETAEAIRRLGYPDRCLCAKPVDRTGGRGLHILDAQVNRFAERMFSKPGPLRCTAEEFLAIRREGPERFPLLVSEWLAGEELGVDLLAEGGRVVELAVRRKGGPMLHGNPARIKFAERSAEREWVTRLTQALNLSGLLSVDARYDGSATLRLLEVNARPGAYIGMTCSRVHLLGWAVDRLLGEPSIEPQRYYGHPAGDSAMRVFADVLVGGGVAEVLNIQGDSQEVASDARAVACGTSG